MSIGVVGDLHIRERLGYADYISDRRASEKQLIFDYILTVLDKCNTIVFMGDQLNSRNNTSESIREFVELVEKFKDKEIYILAGNHEKKGDGKSAIDFMREVNKPNWRIITNTVESCTLNGLRVAFCPYFYRTELEKETDEEGVKDLMSKLKPADILFHHHAVSDTKTETGTSTSIFDEIVLPKKEVGKKFKLVVGGHVHKPQEVDNIIVTGSIFCNEAGETEKFVWTIDEKTLKSKKHKLPGRGIYKLTNPTEAEIKKIDKNNIVKVELTKKMKAGDLDSLKELLRDYFDAYVMLENYPSERKKVDFDEGMMDFNLEKFLAKFAEQRKVAPAELLKAFEIIK